METLGEIPTDGKQTDAAHFTWRHWMLLFCLLAGTLTARLWRVGTPGHLYWDEVYFGYTAQQYLTANPASYDPFATPPVGMAYEWTHPPLGKLIMAGTMAITSRQMWGLRLSSVLFGTAGVAMVVLVAFLLTRSPPAGLLAGLLYAMDGLNFAQSRVATMDIHYTCFILAAAAFYVAWRRRPDASNWLLLGAGAMAGAAVATKWAGVFVIFLMGADMLILWIVYRRRFNLRTFLTAGVCLLIVPALIYFASYIHYFLLGYNWTEFKELQRQMWVYHTTLKAKHNYQSAPWQWLLDLRPVWLYVKYLPNGWIANIYSLGNPAVLYFGLIAIVLTAARFTRRRQWEAGFLLAAYLVFWLPSIASPRIMFFYHYLPSSAFLCMSSGWVLSDWLAGRRRVLRVVGWIVPLLAAAWFVLFYPDLTGIPVPNWWADAVYFFIPSWK